MDFFSGYGRELRGLTAGLLSTDWSVYDGLTITNCSNYNHIEWTYNNGHLLVGAAYLYNFVL